MINLENWKIRVYQPNKHRRPYGAFYIHKVKGEGHNKIYLAWRFKDEQYRLEPGWALDDKTVSEAATIGCTAVGVLTFERDGDAAYGMGKAVELYLTKMEHYQKHAKDHKGECKQKLLSLHYFTSKIVSHA